VFFVALGDQEYVDTMTGGRKQYGDTGLGKNVIHKYTIDNYTEKMERDLKEEGLEEEDRNRITENLLYATHIKASLHSLNISKIEIYDSTDQISMFFDSSKQSNYPSVMQFFIKYIKD